MIGFCFFHIYNYSRKKRFGVAGNIFENLVHYWSCGIEYDKYELRPLYRTIRIIL